MATYHFSMKTGAKGKAAAHVCYIVREGQYREKLDLEYAENGNMPEWASGDPREFWKAADQYERANGVAYREIELALPRELDPDQRRELVLGFVDEHLGGDFPYTLAIHNPKAAIERGEQPHVHIQFSERKLDDIERGWEQFFKRANRSAPELGGCAKDERWNGKDRAEHLEVLRESWEGHVNRAYELALRPERVSCRSLEAQGIEREPERHLGPKLVRDQESVDLVKELREYQRELALIEWDRAALVLEMERERVQELSLSAAPPAKVHSPPLPGRESPLQQPAFDSYEDAAEYQGAYFQARSAVIQEFYREPLERRQAETLLDVDRARKELERATRKRERIEGSWFKVGLAKSKEIEQQAEKAFWKVSDEHQDLETQLQQLYPEEWIRRNVGLMEREMQKRLGPECRQRFDKATELTSEHTRQQVQQRLELKRQRQLQKSLTLGKGRKGPGIGR
jgi:hypothetical protein